MEDEQGRVDHALVELGVPVDGTGTPFVADGAAPDNPGQCPVEGTLRHEAGGARHQVQRPHGPDLASKARVIRDGVPATPDEVVCFGRYKGYCYGEVPVDYLE